MQLRVLRRFDWVNTSTFYGGPPQWSLQSYDTLQYLGEEGDWIDVPVVEDEIPLNPDQEKLASFVKEIEDALPPFVKDEWVK